MRRFDLLVLGLVVLVAGCTGALPTTETSTTATPGDSPAASTTTTQPPATTAPTTLSQTASTPNQRSTTAQPTTTVEPSTTASPTLASTTASDNPWGTRQVVVAVENEAGFAHEKYDLFRVALDYWTANAPRYVGYEVEFVLDPDADSPDVTIQYVESIEECGEVQTSENTLGCATVYRSGHVRDHTVVQIRENDDDTQLVETTKHEFGHVLGIAHGEAPMPLMAEDNLYLHASPWNRSAVTYALDFSDGPGYADEYLESHVDPAFRYFEDGAEGTLDSPPGLVRVDDRSEANVVVEFHAGARPGTNFEGSVVEPRFEGTIEGQPYARYTIALYDLDPDAMAWHVAYLLTDHLLEEGDTRPTVLDPDECGYQCRRGDWWA